MLTTRKTTPSDLLEFWQGEIDFEADGEKLILREKFG